MPRKLISFDWAIKKLLRSKANFGILEGFMSELLFTDIKILEVLESESNKESQKNKFNRVDIKVRDSKGQIILIEIQYSRELDYLLRMLFETSKSIAEHLQEGASYSDVVKIISINILYSDFCVGNDYIYHGTTSFLGLHNKTILKLSEAQKNLFKMEKIADIYPEFYIINVKNFDNVAKDALDEWIYFIKNEEIKDNFHAKGLKEAKEKLDVLKMETAERNDYELHQKDLHHETSLYQSSYVIGLEEGIEKGKKLTAKNLLKLGTLNHEQIAQITGLSIEQIQQLEQYLKK